MFNVFNKKTISNTVETLYSLITTRFNLTRRFDNCFIVDKN